MCGISGVFLRKGESADPALLDAMAGTMIHRGPDAGGVFLEGPIGLVHRRLKVIDLSDFANQPMFSDDKKMAIVYNGEIYNFQAIRKELEHKGHRFRTRSDTEVVLRAFEEWGTGSFEKFNGMFAFGILDKRKSEPVLYLVRDRHGIKPLFYSYRNGRLAFASELKPLMEVSWISKSIDPDTLYYYLQFSHVPNPLSIFKDVQQLRPGTWLQFEGEQLKEGPYWDPDRAQGSPQEELTEEQYLDRLEEVLRNSVARQLVSDVPVGCFLSGGIDSSLLAMSYFSGPFGKAKPIKTFSIGYKEAEFDETGYARLVAREFKTEHHEWIASPRDLFDMVVDVPTYFDQPLGDPTVLPSLILSRFARESVKVVFSGDGGDELFFGYPHQRVLYYLRTLAKIPGRLRKTGLETLGDLALTLSPGPMKLMGQRVRKLSEILQFDNEAELFQYFIGTVGPMRNDRLAQLIVGYSKPAVPLYHPMLEALKNLPGDEMISRVFMKTFLVDTVLTKTDRAGMAFGLEARVPFLDDEMVSFAATVPFGLKLRKNTSKYLLRRLLARRIKDEAVRKAIVSRPKQGFSIPIRDWLRGELRYLLDEYLNEPRIRREGLFDPNGIKTLVREHLNHRANHSHLLWSLTTFQVWKERYSV